MARLSLIVLTSGLLASLSPLASAQQQQAPGLNSLFQAAGKLFFGTATDTNNFNDTAYMNVFNNRNEFGIVVPENSLKWQPTEPTEDNFVFTNPDQVRALAVRNGMMFRCHTLTWFQQLPQFSEFPPSPSAFIPLCLERQKKRTPFAHTRTSFSSPTVTTTQWTRATLTAAIQTHIANVVGHYAGSCYSWDVVNEALNDGNGTFRNSVFFTTLGTDFIPISFRAAAAADPLAKLYYNDFSLEFNSAKTAAALDIVRLVQNSSARIDGVGFQGHLTVGGTPSAQSLAAVFNRFTSLGVEVAITELDIRMTLPSNASAVEQQAQDYMSVMGACLATPRCVGVVVWQFTDKYSWVPSTFAGTGDACLYDQNFAKKPAWTSVSAQLAAAAAAAATARPVTASGVATARASATGAGAAGAMQTGASNGTVQVAGSARAVASLGAAMLAAVSGGFVMFG